MPTTPGFHVTLRALPGKEAAVGAFLERAKAMVDEEPGTLAWFAFRTADDAFAIFDVFDDEESRQVHLHGAVRTALEAEGPELLAAVPVITPVDVVAVKLPPAGG